MDFSNRLRGLLKTTDRGGVVFVSTLCTAEARDPVSASVMHSIGVILLSYDITVFSQKRRAGNSETGAEEKVVPVDENGTIALPRPGPFHVL